MVCLCDKYSNEKQFKFALSTPFNKGSGLFLEQPGDYGTLGRTELGSLDKLWRDRGKLETAW